MGIRGLVNDQNFSGFGEATQYIPAPRSRRVRYGSSPIHTAGQSTSLPGSETPRRQRRPPLHPRGLRPDSRDAPQAHRPYNAHGFEGRQWERGKDKGAVNPYRTTLTNSGQTALKRCRTLNSVGHFWQWVKGRARCARPIPLLPVCTTVKGSVHYVRPIPLITACATRPRSKTQINQLRQKYVFATWRRRK